MALSWIRKHDATGDDVCCCPECDAVQQDPTLTYCTVCGYDIVQQAKIDLTGIRRVTF